MTIVNESPPSDLITTTPAEGIVLHVRALWDTLTMHFADFSMAVPLVLTALAVVSVIGVFDVHGRMSSSPGTYAGWVGI